MLALQLELTNSACIKDSCGLGSLNCMAFLVGRPLSELNFGLLFWSAVADISCQEQITSEIYSTRSAVKVRLCSCRAKQTVCHELEAVGKLFGPTTQQKLGLRTTREKTNLDEKRQFRSLLRSPPKFRTQRPSSGLCAVLAVLEIVGRHLSYSTPFDLGL